MQFYGKCETQSVWISWLRYLFRPLEMQHMLRNNNKKKLTQKKNNKNWTLWAGQVCSCVYEREQCVHVYVTGRVSACSNQTPVAARHLGKRKWIVSDLPLPLRCPSTPRLFLFPFANVSILARTCPCMHILAPMLVCNYNSHDSCMCPLEQAHAHIHMRARIHMFCKSTK